MADATPTANVIADYAVNGERKWAMHFKNSNMNSSFLDIHKHDFDWLFNQEGVVILRRMSFCWLAQSCLAGCAAFVNLFQTFGAGTSTAIIVTSMQSIAPTTIYDWSTHVWEGAEPVDWWRNMSDDAVLIQWVSDVAKAHNADAVHIVIEGDIISLPSDASHMVPQPVSLEGYKWPLSRR